jgi:hypothetical protein
MIAQQDEWSITMRYASSTVIKYTNEPLYNYNETALY